MSLENIQKHEVMNFDVELHGNSPFTGYSYFPDSKKLYYSDNTMMDQQYHTALLEKEM